MKPLLNSSLALVLALVSCGCQRGPAVAPVEGVVTMNGEPLTKAMVEFQPDAGTPSYGYTDQSGHYELMYQVDRGGALLGRHNVRVRTAGEKTDLETDMTYTVRESVPAEYNEESELYYEVKRGPNTFDIEITGSVKRGRR